MSIPLVPAPRSIHYDSTLGALFVGEYQWIFYATGCLQTFNYFMNHNFKKDHVLLRLLVAFLWLLDIGGSLTSSKFCYAYFVTNYNNPIALLSLPDWSGSAFMTFESASDGFVRSLFIYRIWKLRRQVSLAIVLMVLNLLTMAFNFGRATYYASTTLAIAAKYQQLQIYSKLEDIKWMIISSFTLISVTDTTIAAILCYLLKRMKSASTLKRTSLQLETLMLYSIHTGALTSVCGICVVITYLAMPNNMVFMSIYLILPKLYHNALLATLNGRETLRNTKHYDHICLSKVTSSTPDTTTSSTPHIESFNDEIIIVDASGSNEVKSPQLCSSYVHALRRNWLNFDYCWDVEFPKF
ncbi:hypothetical protein C8Q75DRAFT_733397 [Abortiporus biennis]|nr:hypothetical protein C8Q75DRAFT_733397 [Abortiporus biennis]